MSRRADGPPRLARALLDRLLPADDPGSATGDLDEEYARFVRPRRGRRAADAWYWRQVLLSAPRLLLARLRRPVPRATVSFGDLRLALRVLARRPGLTVAAVATLGLGLGANAAVFSVVHAVLVRPLPYANADRLVRPVPGELFFLDVNEARALDERMTTLEAFVPWGRTLFLLTGGDGAEEVRGARVGWNHFDVLGVDAMLGRTFDRADADSDDVVVLSHGLWVRRFGADPDVVGSTLGLYGRDVTVIGVLSPSHVPIEFDWEAWRPLPSDPALSQNMGLAGTGLLRTGVSLDQAREEFRIVVSAIWAETGYVASEEERAGLEVVTLRDWLLGDARPALLALAAAVGIVLLLAGANVANLLVAHGGSRSREFAVRSALGGARLRIAGQVFTEVAVLGAAGCAVALGVAVLALDVLAGRLPPDMPRISDVAVTGPVVVFTVAATIAVAFGTALLPALRASGPRLGGLAASGRGSGPGSERARARTVLVASEVAMAVLLVVGAGLMLRTMASLSAVDPGFDQMGVVTVRPSPPADRYPEGPALDAYYDEAQAALARLPGVRSVGAIQFLPMTPGGWWTSYVPEGAILRDDENRPNTAVRVVREGYFETMRIPIVAGRAIEDGDGEREGPVPVIVNESLAAAAFPGVSAVGKRVSVADMDAEVVGIVGDVRQSDLRSDGHTELYLPFAVVPWRRMHLVARVETDAASMLASVAGAMRSLDPEISLLGPRGMDEVVGATIVDTRLLASLLTIFGIVGLALGAVGVYGVTAQSVADRRREIGVRIALGAEASTVATATVLRGLAPVAVGLTVGMTVALGGARMLEGLLFEVPPHDPRTFVVAPVVLLMAAAASLIVPAVRAARVDPVKTLREE